MSIETVRGKQITIQFNGERCIHSRHCVLDRPDVFVPGVEGEWIRPDNASAGELAALARNCPSGAIRFVQADGTPGEKSDSIDSAAVLLSSPVFGTYEALSARVSAAAEGTVEVDGRRAAQATVLYALTQAPPTGIDPVLEAWQRKTP